MNNTMISSRLIVIAGPSGCGKTTIVRSLLKRHPEILFSVSATTRPKRATEIDGKDYFFLTKDDFNEKIGFGELAEWEQIYGDYYGSLKSEIEGALASGKPMLFDVDVKGALSIKKKYPKEAILIFIKPPNLKLLTERLKSRRTETPDTIAKRLERVAMELKLAREFDHCVVNDILDRAIETVDEIVRREIKK